MTKEELLMPRIQVINPYPGCQFKVGTILTKNEKINSGDWANIEGHGLIGMKISEMEPYPHLFKPLQWWEYRKPEDMPEYVKDAFNQIHKPTSWGVFNGGVMCVIRFGMCKASNLMPATESEYNEYINNNRGKQGEKA